MLDLNRFAVRPVLDAIESGDRWHGRRGPGRDHDRARGLVRGAVDRYLAGAGELAGTTDEVAPLTLESFDSHTVVPVIGRHIADAACDRRPVGFHGRLPGESRN